jgi:hypothetical protein
MVADPAALIGFAGVVGVLGYLFGPMRCSAPIGTAPFRPCRRPLKWLFGSCQHHGSRPGLRLVRRLGGSRLLTRRVCDKCGRSRVFLRMPDGAPYLGCVGFPNCKDPRMLKDYRF